MPNINLESLRPYHVESTSSRLITEVKQHWALWVLGWVTTWEHRVLKTFLLIFCIYLRQFVTRGWEEWNVSAGLSKQPSNYSLIHFYKRLNYCEQNMLETSKLRDHQTYLVVLHEYPFVISQLSNFSLSTGLKPLSQWDDRSAATLKYQKTGDVPLLYTIVDS